ncbi:MAG: nickel pincer cofactor biosynthesis protein LarC [Candidatus Longimicrobiales bacterium M2_2A_002]
MQGLIIDPFAGISGDMLLGALVDLGLAPDRLRSFVEATGLDAEVRVERVDRSGIACARVVFVLPEEQSHRHLSDVLEVVRSAKLPEPVRDRAESVFRRLAEAEASVHGVDVESVHFHEVGALDSILDVVCVAAAVDALGYTAFYTRPVAVGTGTVTMDHGEYPLPAPATARLLRGLPVRDTGYAEERTTPTGAALLAELTGGTFAPSEVIYGRSGYGAGSRDPAGRPNCLRLQECRVVAPSGREPAEAGQAVYALQADIDDLAPEYVVAAREALVEAGALDVTVLRVDMKKGRPGVRLEALAPEAWLERVVDAFFVGTSTIGVRFWRVERAVLARTETVVEWREHPIRVKRVTLPDGSARWKPEYDDVAAAARAEGVTPYEVRSELREEESRDGS